jgi:hypothetical protein
MSNEFLTITQQKSIVNLGNLSSLRCFGKVIFTSLINSVSPTTGSVTILGGVGIQDTVYIGKNLNVGGYITCLEPIQSNHTTTKEYVDSKQFFIGKGLLLNGKTISIKPIQHDITEIGTLRNLDCNGPVHLYNTENSTDIYSGSLNVKGGVGIHKHVHIGGNIFVNGELFFNKCTVKDPENDTDIVNKRYLEKQLETRYDKDTLEVVNGSLKVSCIQKQITSVGNLKHLQVDGTSTFNGPVFVNNPINSSHVANKKYVDDSIPIVYTGLSKINNKISVNSDLGHVNNIGTLLKLNVSGESNLDSVIVQNNLEIRNNLKVVNISSNYSKIDKCEIDQLICKQLLLDKKLKIGSKSILQDINCMEIECSVLKSTTLNVDSIKCNDYANFNKIDLNVLNTKEIDCNNLSSNTFTSDFSNIKSLESNDAIINDLVVKNIKTNSLVVDNLTCLSSFSINVKNINQDYTVQQKDHCIIADKHGKNIKITIPSDIVFNQGQVVYFLNLSHVYNILVDVGVGVGEYLLDFKNSYIELIYINREWKTKSTNVKEFNIKKNVIIAYGGIYGDGCMGDQIISSNTVLTSDVYYNNLTINENISLKTNGWRIFVKNVLYLKKKSIIHNNGHDPESTLLPSQHFSSYLGCGINGTVGEKLNGYQNIQFVESKSSCCESNIYCLVESGGKGGGSNDKVKKSNLLPNSFGGVHCIKNFPSCTTGRIDNIKVYTSLGGGSGYAKFSIESPKQTDFVKPGSGGGSAGFVVICSRIIKGFGSIQANGANGSNGSTNVDVKLVTVGGGGGGSGGITSIITSTPIGKHLELQVNSGKGGKSINCENGQDGSDGIIIQNLI